MSNKEIKIKHEELENQVTILKQSIYDFQECTKSFSTDTVNSFSGLNSDFIEAIKKVITYMGVDKSESLIKDAKGIENEINTLVKSFKNHDEMLSKKEQ